MDGKSIARGGGGGRERERENSPRTLHVLYTGRKPKGLILNNRCDPFCIQSFEDASVDAVQSSSLHRF